MNAHGVVPRRRQGRGRSASILPVVCSAGATVRHLAVGFAVGRMHHVGRIETSWPLSIGLNVGLVGPAAGVDLTADRKPMAPGLVVAHETVPVFTRFRDSLSGREAYMTSHRVAVWEVLAVREETKSVETVSYFRWPRVLVTQALAYAKAFPEEIRRSRDGETDTASAAG
jgi:hypothetical protein